MWPRIIPPAIVFDSIKLFHIYYLQKMVFSL